MKKTLRIWFCELNILHDNLNIITTIYIIAKDIFQIKYKVVWPNEKKKRKKKSGQRCRQMWRQTRHAPTLLLGNKLRPKQHPCQSWLPPHRGKSKTALQSPGKRQRQSLRPEKHFLTRLTGQSKRFVRPLFDADRNQLLTEGLWEACLSHTRGKCKISTKNLCHSIFKNEITCHYPNMLHRAIINCEMVWLVQAQVVHFAHTASIAKHGY